jgi:hypothetical protein
MAMLRIGGQDVPSPCGMQLEVTDVSAGKRNALGEVVMDQVAIKHKLELSWARLTGGELELVFGLAGGSGVFFEVLYPDGSQQRAMTAYAAAKSARLLSCQSGVPLWTDVKIILRER